MRRGAIALPIVILVVLAVTAGGVAYLVTHEAKLLEIGVPIAQRFVPGLRVGSLEIDFPKAVHARDVVLTDRDGGDAIKADDVVAEWRWSSMLEGHIDAVKVHVSHARVVMFTRPDGELNLAAIVPLSEPGPESWAALQLPYVSADDIEIEDVTFEALDPDLAFTAHLEHVTAAGWMVGHSFECRLDQLRGSFTGFGFHAATELTANTAMWNNRVDGDVQLRVAGFSAQPLDVDLRIDGLLGAIATAMRVSDDKATRLSANVGFDLEHTETLALVTRAHFNQLSFAQFIPGFEGVVNGEVSLALRGTPLAPDGEVKVVAQLSKTAIAGQSFDALSVVGETHGKHWHVQQAHIALSGATVDASGKGTLGGAMQGHLDATFPKGFVVPVANLLLHGHVVADASGSDLRTAKATVDAELAYLSVGPVVLRDLVTHLAYEAQGEKLDGDVHGTLEVAQAVTAVVPFATKIHATEVASREPHGTVVLRVAGATVARVKNIALELDAAVTRTSTRLNVKLGRAEQQLISAVMTSTSAWSGVRSLAGAMHLPLKLVIESPWRPLQTWYGLATEQPTVDVSGDASVYVELDGMLYRPDLIASVSTRKARIAERELGTLEIKVNAEDTGGSSKLKAELRWHEEMLAKVQGVIGLGVDSLVQGRAREGAQVQAELEIVPIALQRLAPLLRAQGSKSIPGWLAAKGSVYGAWNKPKADVILWVANSPADASAQHAPLTVTAQLQPPYAQHVDLTLYAKQFDLAAIDNFVPAIRHLEGTLDGTVTHTGELSIEHVEGTLALSAPVFSVRNVPTVEQLTGKIEIKAGHFMLVEGKGRFARGGALTIHAEAEPKGESTTQFDLALEADGLALDYRGLEKVTADAKLEAHATLRLPKGETDVPELKGDVELRDLRIRLPELTKLGLESRASTGLPNDVVLVDSLEREPPPLTTEAQPLPIALDLQVKLHDLGVRGPDVELHSRASLRAATNDKRQLAMTGLVEINRGYVMILSRRWDVSTARLGFNGATDIDPALDVRLTRQFPDVFVTLGVTGTIRRPVLVLQSNPACYDKSQLLSLVVTGRSEQGRARGGADALAAIVMQSLLKGVAGPLTSKIGIDVVRVGVESQTSTLGQNSTGARTTFEVGKWLTEKLYVGYERGFGANDGTKNANTLKLEFQLAPRLMLEGAFGDAGVGGLDLLWMYRY